VVIAVVIFMFAGGGKKPASAPKAVAEVKPQPKQPETKPTTPKREGVLLRKKQKGCYE
jgi:hypothetical protein